MIRNLFRKKNRIENDDAYSVGKFIKAIELECARVDRNEQPFSLLLFEVGTKPDIARRLGNLLQKKLRTTDLNGWLDNDSLGVILPYTPAQGAWNIASRICDRIEQINLNSDCVVYTYPTSWPTNGDGNSPYEKLSNFSQQGKTQKINPRNNGKNKQIFEVNSKMSALNFSPIRAQRIPLWKRTFDIIGASLALILFAPLFFLIAILVKLSSEGPVIYKQMRIGYQGEHFMLLKFRTMIVNSDHSIHKQRVDELINSEQEMTKLDDDDDPRIIFLGKVLRVTGLDELPQLINVLRGEMSLVGPRPCLLYEVKRYNFWHHSRFNTLPGLTGLWQVSGKNKTSFKEMQRLDIRYSRNISFLLDMKIMLKTIPAIIKQVLDSNSKDEEVINA